MYIVKIPGTDIIPTLYYTGNWLLLKWSPFPRKALKFDNHEAAQAIAEEHEADGAIVEFT